MKLDSTFYARPADVVAPTLLGTTLVIDIGAGDTNISDIDAGEIGAGDIDTSTVSTGDVTANSTATGIVDIEANEVDIEANNARANKARANDVSQDDVSTNTEKSHTTKSTNEHAKRLTKNTHPKGQLPTGRYQLRIVETEAYVGTHDLACHASKGRTPRTEVMFGAAGHVYIYLIYGMYYMFNIVTGNVGEGQAVLVRAAEPLEPNPLPVKTDGPGKLCRALGIDKRYNGASLQQNALHLRPGTPPRHIVTTPRVGIDYAGDWKDAPLRFFDADSEHVSGRKKRPQQTHAAKHHSSKQL